MANTVAPVVFFNIGWMRDYRGAASNDQTVGGHRYLKTNSYGGEAFNFVPFRGRFYGYRPTGEKGVNIGRIGAGPRDDSVNGVTVVWMARRPESKNTVIVGWYRNATVHRAVQTVSQGAPVREWPEYMVEAAVEDCRLLPVEARNFQILSSHRRAGSFGQSPTFYDSLDLYRTEVSAYINRVEANVVAAKRQNGRGDGRNTNPEQRRQIEVAAVDHATAYYKSEEGGGWSVE